MGAAENEGAVVLAGFDEGGMEVVQCLHVGVVSSHVWWLHFCSFSHELVLLVTNLLRKVA